MDFAAIILDEVAANPEARAALRAHVPDLIAALDDPYPASGRRAAVASVLGRLGSEAAEAVPKLLPLLKLPDPGDRTKVVEALGSIAPSSAEVQSALGRIAADDPLPMVREAARRLTSQEK